jgi:hypothetical protein
MRDARGVEACGKAEGLDGALPVGRLGRAVPEGEAVVDQLRLLRLPLRGAALVSIIAAADAAELGLDRVVVGVVGVIVDGLGRGRLAGLLVGVVIVVVDQLELRRERGGEGDALCVERMSLADRQL